MTPSETTKTTKTQNVLAASLWTLFFTVFVCACVSRWLAYYGPGLAVPLIWCAIIGGVVGGITAGGWIATNFLISLVRSATKREGPDTRRFFASIRAAMIAGVVFGAIGFVYATVAGVKQVLAKGVSFEAQVTGYSGTLVPMTTFGGCLIAPAVIGAFANSIACIAREYRRFPLLFTALVCIVMAAVSGIFPAAALVVGVLFRPSHPHGPGYENMDGLLPLAAVLWFTIGATIGAAVGTVTSVLWLWASHAQSSRISWIAIWSFGTLVALLITELGLNQRASQALFG